MTGFDDAFVELHRSYALIRALTLIQAEASSLITLSDDDKLFIASALEHELLES